MTPTPPWAGSWRLDYVPPRTLAARWESFLCAWLRHRWTESDHYHGLFDWRGCDRCRWTWVRDGCAARDCGERGGVA